MVCLLVRVLSESSSQIEASLLAAGELLRVACLFLLKTVRVQNRDLAAVRIAESLEFSVALVLDPAQHPHASNTVDIQVAWRERDNFGVVVAL